MESDDFIVHPEEYESFFSKIDEDLDFAFALSLQDEETKSEELNSKPSFSCTSKSPSETLGIVDPQWELIDPNPDIHALFLQYNTQFFYGKLDGVEVKWSPRMTLCAGVCSYEGRGGLCSVRLSLPLLKLRSRRDLVETLLHEMIHAYLFVTANNKDHNAHGPEFLKHMNRINKETGTRISVYHSFHDEVDLYRKHWWKCNGSCQNKRPFFGLVKRAVNRAPGPTDFWWSQHQSSCGGTFIKVKEPDGFKKKTLKRKPLKDANNQSLNIKKFLKSPSSEEPSINSPSTSKTKNEFDGNNVKSILSKDDTLEHVLSDYSNLSSTPKSINITPFSGKGFQLGSSSSAAPKSFLAALRSELKSSNVKDTNLCQKNTQCEFSHSWNNKQTQTDSTKSKGSVLSNSQNISANNTFKSPNFVQSSIESYVASPSRSSKEKSREEEPIVINDTEHCISKVECPVCFDSFTNLEINSHLDFCLLKQT